MLGPENKPQQYQPPGPLTLGFFDLEAARRNAIVKLAHLRQTSDLDDWVARKLIAERDNNHPLRNSLVQALLKRLGVSEIYVELPVKDGRLQIAGRFRALKGETVLLEGESSASIEINKKNNKKRPDSLPDLVLRPYHPKDLAAHLNLN